MPVLSRMEASNKIVAHNPQDCTVFVTTHTLEEFKSADAAGATNDITKPFRLTDLESLFDRFNLVNPRLSKPRSSIPEISVRQRASVAALQRWNSWKRPNSDHGVGGTALATSHRSSNGDDSGSEILDVTTEPENTLQRDEALGSHRTPIDQTDARKFITTHCRRPYSGDARYAINPDSLFPGILNLNLETRILSSLPLSPQRNQITGHFQRRSIRSLLFYHLGSPL